MKTFRPTQRDEQNIATIILKRGAANQSEAFRMALEETASGEPQLAILPQLPPIKDLRQTKTVFDQFHRTLADAIRTGWPDHIQGESPERTAKVLAARQVFDEMLQTIRPRCHELMVLCAAKAGATAVDIKGAKAAAQYLAKSVRDTHRQVQNSEVPETELKKARRQVDFYQPLIELHEKIGLT